MLFGSDRCLLQLDKAGKSRINAGKGRIARRMHSDTAQRCRKALHFRIYVEQVIKRLHCGATVRSVKGKLKPKQG